MHNAVSVHSLILMMCDMHDGGALRLQIIENTHHFGARRLVQHGGRLIQHQHGRTHGQHAGNGGALLLASTHTSWIGLAEGRQSNRF